MTDLLAAAFVICLISSAGLLYHFYHYHRHSYECGQYLYREGWQIERTLKNHEWYKIIFCLHLHFIRSYSIHLSLCAYNDDIRWIVNNTFMLWQMAICQFSMINTTERKIVWRHMAKDTMGGWICNGEGFGSLLALSLCLHCCLFLSFRTFQLYSVIMPFFVFIFCYFFYHLVTSGPLDLLCTFVLSNAILIYCCGQWNDSMEEKRNSRNMTFIMNNEEYNRITKYM